MKLTIKNMMGTACLSSMLLLSASCSDSFLQRDALTESSSNTYWQTPNDAMMALAACYDALQNNQLYNADQFTLGPLYLECISDNGGHFNWNGWMEGYDVAMGIHNPSTWLFGDYWKACYEVINRCNLLTANVDRVNISDSEKRMFKAEAIVLRALIYANLTITFQDVPYLTEPLTLENPECAKTPKEKIVDAVLADLKEVAPDLPEKADLGRITRGAAYAILGRMALYHERWDEAITAYREVQKLDYSLHPSYSSLFTLAGQNSSEIIFSVRYEGPGLSEGTAFNAHWNTPLEAMNGTLNLADDYYLTDGTPVADRNYGEMDNEVLDVTRPNAAHFENRDPRLYTTLFVPGMYWNGKGGEGNWYGGAAASLSMVYVMKYFDPKDTGNSWDSGQDFYVVRYAEVLLSLAEALVQKGSYDESEVIALINQVRQRADVNMPTVETVEGTGLTKEKLLEVIKHERRVELAFEGLRLFDIYRWKELDKAVERVENERTSLGLSYEPRQYNGERDYVWPIPTGELDTNSLLEQHELWK